MSNTQPSWRDAEPWTFTYRNGLHEELLANLEQATAARQAAEEAGTCTDSIRLAEANLARQVIADELNHVMGNITSGGIRFSSDTFFEMARRLLVGTENTLPNGGWDENSEMYGAEWITSDGKVKLTQ